jgi:hypothetical protein
MLLEADEEFPEPIVARASALNDPSARRMPPMLRRAFTAMPEVDDVMALADRDLDLWEVVPLIEAQVLRILDRRAGTPDDAAIQRGPRRFHVMGIGGSHHHWQRDTALVDQRVPLRAELAAVRRIRAC